MSALNILQWIDPSITIIFIVILLIVLLFYGDRIRNKAYWDKYIVLIGDKDESTQKEEQKRVDKFFKEYGNPYHNLNYIIIIATLFTILSPRWSDYYFCNTLADIYTFSKVIFVGGIFFIYQAKKMDKNAFSTTPTYATDYPTGCGYISLHYFILGILMILIPILILLLSTNVTCKI